MRSFKDFEKALNNAVKKMSSPSKMREYGEAAADLIRVRTRLGYGVREPGGKKERLKALSDSYVEQRKNDKRLSNLTTAKKSNLTRTAQMLESVSVLDAKQDEVRVGPSGTRDDGEDNASVAGFVTDAGRPFNNLSDIETKRVVGLIEQSLQESIDKDLK